jgi:hypothetical protein
VVLVFLGYGVTGRVVQIEGNWYRIQTMDRDELRIYVDQSSRRDDVSVGDHVHLYVSKDRDAAFVQKIDSTKER